MPWWGWLLLAIFVGVPVLSILVGGLGFLFVSRDIRSQSSGSNLVFRPGPPGTVSGGYFPA